MFRKFVCVCVSVRGGGGGGGLRRKDVDQNNKSEIREVSNLYVKRNVKF